jgi:hypothetical protein
MEGRQAQRQAQRQGSSARGRGVALASSMTGAGLSMTILKERRREGLKAEGLAVQIPVTGGRCSRYR